MWYNCSIIWWICLIDFQIRVSKQWPIFQSICIWNQTTKETRRMRTPCVFYFLHDHFSSETIDIYLGPSVCILSNTTYCGCSYTDLSGGAGGHSSQFSWRTTKRLRSDFAARWRKDLKVQTSILLLLIDHVPTTTTDEQSLAGCGVCTGWEWPRGV